MLIRKVEKQNLDKRIIIETQERKKNREIQKIFKLEREKQDN